METRAAAARIDDGAPPAEAVVFEARRVALEADHATQRSSHRCRRLEAMNHLARRFAVRVIAGPDRVSASEITVRPNP